MFYAIVRIENNRVAKYQDFITPEEAQAHVDKYGGFVHESDRPYCELFIDDGAVTIVPTEIPAQKKPLQDALIELLIVKGIITAQDIEASISANVSDR